MLKQQSLLHDYSMHLTDEEIRNPTEVFREFFGNYHLQEATDDLLDLVRVGLVTDDTTYDTGIKRSNLLFLHQQLKRVIEAAHSQIVNEEKILGNVDIRFAELDNGNVRLCFREGTSQ